MNFVMVFLIKVWIPIHTYLAVSKTEMSAGRGNDSKTLIVIIIILTSQSLDFLLSPSLSLIISLSLYLSSSSVTSNTMATVIQIPYHYYSHSNVYFPIVTDLSFTKGMI
jgi:hypothetical protein